MTVLTHFSGNAIPTGMRVRPLRLAFVFSTRSMGGMESRAARLAQLARQRGHSVLFGCPPGSRPDERLAQYGVPRFGLYIHGALDLVSAMKLAGCLKRCRADLVRRFPVRITG